MNILRPYKFFAAAALLLTGSSVYAQTNPTMVDPAQAGRTDEPVTSGWRPSLVKDGVIDRAPHISQALQWQPVREADVFWKKRVWREIDTRERQNQAFRFPGDDQTGGGYFIEILVDAIKRGKVKAYSQFSDRFTIALTKEQIMDALTGKDDSVTVIDPKTGASRIEVTHREFNPDVVTRYRIKEDWIFDRNLGRMVVRIIGIAPIGDIYDPNTNEYRGSSPLFWLYYPELRNTLAQYEVFNPENDVARITWDDYFEGRFFSSHITKVSNAFDEHISNQRQGVEALYTGQQEAEKIFNKEHDMWVY